MKRPVLHSTEEQRHYLTGCRGKLRYSPTAAGKVALRLSVKEGADYNAYLCPFCHRWHVGHRRSRRKKEDA